MWNARRQSSTSAVAAGAIILSATGRSPTCGKQLRQHHGPLPVRRKASARASPQHDSVAWNQDAQLSHTTPNSTTCARGSNGCGLHRRGHCRRSAHFFANWAHARLGGTLAASPHRYSISRLRKRAWPEICKNAERPQASTRQARAHEDVPIFRVPYAVFWVPYARGGRTFVARAAQPGWSSLGPAWTRRSKLPSLTESAIYSIRI